MRLTFSYSVCILSQAVLLSMPELRRYIHVVSVCTAEAPQIISGVSKLVSCLAKLPSSRTWNTPVQVGNTDGQPIRRLQHFNPSLFSLMIKTTLEHPPVYLPN
ncbi:uncharacterized protein BCR38DRAFT_214985 [Pseudomassariella vexata]|uniref:Uncharacterized protein n=1 Tax=Pseudomassariella vexata TaxID=1141098 RepID=A0A1Y2DZ02_9PEZI|nr:uncharacterized protein BCR38DRAFT_214985 [Pseudomassariella vexata]ORY64449.1 hypothetical protein BCR38DRAFT_214985 [Pseudomassariella vexata]